VDFPSEREARVAMVEVGRRLYARALINGGEGNLSCRLGPDLVLCTPSGANKGFLREEELVVTDLSGKPVLELRKPSSELLLHLACYEERPDCVAVVHAHPPHAVALSLIGDGLLACMPEAVTALGEVPTAPYATPGTSRVADSVRPHVRAADCVLMERHGALCLGFGRHALFEACDRMEMLEGVARVQLLASHRCVPSPLPPEEQRILAEQRTAGQARTAAGQAHIAGSARPAREGDK
jgi:L-fuculose-phosphate aldolase